MPARLARLARLASQARTDDRQGSFPGHRPECSPIQNTLPSTANSRWVSPYSIRLSHDGNISWCCGRLAYSFDSGCEDMSRVGTRLGYGIGGLLPASREWRKGGCQVFMHAQHHDLHLRRSPLLKLTVSEPACLRFINYIRCRTPPLCLATETEISGIDSAY